MTPANFFFIATASCMIIITVLIAGALLAVILVARTIQRRIAEFRAPHRLAIVSPWALIAQDLFREGLSWYRSHYGSKTGAEGQDTPPRCP
ncbi:MAG: hypothetical protein V2A77_10440 [Pseudomonadota bacterium]